MISVTPSPQQKIVKKEKKEMNQVLGRKELSSDSRVNSKKKLMSKKESQFNKEKVKVDLLKVQLRNAKAASTILPPSLDFKTIHHRIAKGKKKYKCLFQ